MKGERKDYEGGIKGTLPKKENKKRSRGRKSKVQLVRRGEIKCIRWEINM